MDNRSGATIASSLSTPFRTTVLRSLHRILNPNSTGEYSPFPFSLRDILELFPSLIGQI